jgi:VCBS repeat-containing protein
VIIDRVNGNWTYNLDNAAANVQALGADDTVTDNFTVTSQDGTATENVVVTVTGTDDAPAAANDMLEDTSVVVFDLVQGVSSDHSGRTFADDVSYTIYIKVDSNSYLLNTDERGPDGTSWGKWLGADNLGSDDQVVLVGNDDTGVSGRNGDITRFLPADADAARIYYASTKSVNMAVRVQEESGLLAHYGQSWAADSESLWTGKPAGLFPAPNAEYADVYLKTLPVDILTSQGLV